jgi:hypothetical protein
MNAQNLEIWKKRLIFVSGAVTTLILTALTDLPFPGMGENHRIDIDGWFGIWFILETTCLVTGAYLLLSPRWKEIPFPLRMNPIFSYFTAAWVTLLALSMHLTVLMPTALHFFVAGMGFLLVASYAIVRWRTNRLEEIFP